MDNKVILLYALLLIILFVCYKLGQLLVDGEDPAAPANDDI